MAFFGSILGAKRGDFNLFLIAALVALLVIPGASHAAMPPQSYEAVLFWLQSETAAPVQAPTSSASRLLSISHQKAENPPQFFAETQFSAATAHCGLFRAQVFPPEHIEAHITPATPVFERHAMARLSGVRTNRRLI
ncbi:MAG TPA: hypothetical protein VGB45_02240 [Abditibacterium sp.]|jgi:hypothetical protein